jgi:MGT family glycosyltransferase
MNVLAYTSPARGHLYPVVPIALELAARGHQVHVRTFSVELERLRHAGLECSAIDGAIERDQLEDWRSRWPPRASASVFRTFGARAQREGPDLARAIAEHRPDMLLIDINCWGAAAAAERAGLPWAMYSPYLLPLRSRDAPPFGLGLAPRDGPFGALRDALARRVVERLFDRAALPKLNRARAREGLTPLRAFADTLTRPPLLLALTAEGFEYPRMDWPANVRLVGPMSWTPSQQRPAWLGQLGEPLVLVTCSSERQRDGRLLELALAALPPQGLSVLGTSAAHDPNAFRASAESRVVRFLDHEAALARAACVVCHGGMGIVQKALVAGVPVVAVPFGRDQFETARRVQVAEAGVALMPWRLSGPRLAAAVAEAIGRRAGAARVGRAFAEAGGQGAAAEAIERLARA